MTALRNLWNSTANLHARFFPIEPPDFDARWRVFFEELGEFTAEISLPQDISCGKELSEGADLLVTMIGLLQLRGFTIDDFEAAMNHIAEKNDCKTLETHAVRTDGKIARKG